MTQKNSSGSFHRELGLFAVNCYCFCKKRDTFCTAEINDNHPTSENGKCAVLASGRPAFRQHAKRTEGSDTTPSFACVESPARRVKKTATSPNCKQSSAAQWAATPRDSDAHKRIVVPKAFCVLRVHTRPRPKSGKVRRSDTRPGEVCERAVRVEGSDSGPVRKARVSACGPLCAILLRKPSVYPLSRMKANVGRLCRRC